MNFEAEYTIRKQLSLSLDKIQENTTYKVFSDDLSKFWRWECTWKTERRYISKNKMRNRPGSNKSVLLNIRRCQKKKKKIGTDPWIQFDRNQKIGTGPASNRKILQWDFYFSESKIQEDNMRKIERLAASEDHRK